MTNKRTEPDEIRWQCTNCQKIHTSLAAEHHQMDVCDCGQCGIDLETYCCRIMGNVKILKEIHYDFKFSRGIK